MEESEESRSRAVTLSLIALLAVAVLQRGWNAFSVPPLTGYDSPAHAAYMLSILEEGELPHPYSGWSTFHPPLYYLVGSAVWALLEPVGPRTLVAGLRGIGSLAGLLAGLVAFRLILRLGYDPWVAWVAAALTLFVPVAQLAGAMIGNEALAGGLAALVLPALLVLQRDPRDLRATWVAGIIAGLAVSTKYTGALVACATCVPFLAALLRRDVDRKLAGRALLCGVLILAIGAPAYLRNIAVAGTPLPLARTRDPMKGAEAELVLRERRPLDFVWVPPEALLRPSLYQEPGKVGSFRNRNHAMTSVWGLTYASVWYDPFGHRTSVREHRDGVWYGPTLTLLGLAPTLAMLLGFGLALREAWLRRLQCADAPLTVLALLGLLLYTLIAVAAPSAAALKASYLLGMGVPAAVFYARGLDLMPRPVRLAGLGLSIAACAVACLVFTSGVLYPPMPMGVRVWKQFDALLPGSHIAEAIERLTIGWF
jgi:4-amino-4-deoxy-L-arabinose transferase-like glycosyltransferase